MSTRNDLNAAVDKLNVSDIDALISHARDRAAQLRQQHRSELIERFTQEAKALGFADLSEFLDIKPKRRGRPRRADAEETASAPASANGRVA